MYYEHDKGRHLNSSSTMEDVLDKSGSDLAASNAMVQLEPPEKKNKKDPTIIHRQQVNKCSQLLSRLGRSITNLEVKLPVSKRRLSNKEFLQVKEGLASCRDAKEKGLDELEDKRPWPSVESEQQMVMDGLASLQASIMEHNTAIQDVTNKYGEAPAVKPDPDAESREANDMQKRHSGPLKAQRHKFHCLDVLANKRLLISLM